MLTGNEQYCSVGTETWHDAGGPGLEESDRFRVSVDA